MYLKIGRKILNTDNLVDTNVFESGESLSPYGEGCADTLTVVITMTAMETAEDGVVTAAIITIEPECGRYSTGRNPERLGYHDRTQIRVFDPNCTALLLAPIIGRRVGGFSSVRKMG